MAEIHESARNLEVAQMVGRDEAQVCAGGRSHLAHHRPDLPPIRPQRRLFQLLDFDRDEIYFQREPALDGKNFGDAIMA